MNRQEVFNRVRDHLLTQKIQSTADDELSCMYRGKNGTKCAIGCLIADEHYSRKLEGAGPSDARVHTALQLSGVTYDPKMSGDVYVLRGLQTLHDDYAPETWPQALTDFALKWGLTP